MSGEQWRVASDSVGQKHGEVYVTNDPTNDQYPHESGSLSTSGKAFIRGSFWFRVDWNDGELVKDVLNRKDNSHAALVQALREAIEEFAEIQAEVKKGYPLASIGEVAHREIQAILAVLHDYESGG